MAEEIGGEGITARKLLTYFLLAIIGSIIIAYGVASIHVPLEKPYEVIHTVFREKVCKEYIVDLVLEKEASIARKAVHGAVNITCLGVHEVPESLNNPVAVRKQVLAAVIFYVSILSAIMFWERRVAAVFIGLVALVLTGVLPFRIALESMELHLILFLVGMMIVVGYLKETGFLRFISVKMVMASGGKPSRFLALLMILAFGLAALVDEVSSIVYVTLLILETSELLGLNPIPWLLVAVFATNIGSSATMIGNPIGIYIGLYFDLTFPDFIRYATPAALAALASLYPVASLYLRRELEKMSAAFAKGLELNPWAEVKNKTDFYFSGIIFLLTITGIALHTELSILLNNVLEALGVHGVRLTSHDVLVLVPLLFAGIVMLRAGFEARKLVEERVEWWALVFFMFLFAEAAALSYTGVTDKLAYLLMASVGGAGVQSVEAGIAANILMMFVSAITSGFIDNMPIIVALSPVAKTLMEVGLLGSFMLPWSLLFGGTMGGNLTIIGSTANIVAAGMAEKRGLRIAFGDWIKIGAVVVAVTLFVSSIWLATHVILFSRPL